MYKTETVVAEFDEEGQDGKFVAFDEGFQLDLEDLLRASAYVIGKSRSGIVYRVVAAEPSSSSSAVVAVRRLSDGNATWRFKEFENEVENIGRVSHPNIVRLRAYYYAEDEKLLITDYIGSGSLYSALHGKTLVFLIKFQNVILILLLQTPNYQFYLNIAVETILWESMLFGLKVQSFFVLCDCGHVVCSD